jgi:hypothetical protein
MEECRVLTVVTQFTKEKEMEYARLTDGNTTIIVVDQDDPENAAWPFAIKMKTGSKQFKQVDARLSLGLAIQAATEEFRHAAQRIGTWGQEY